VAGLTEFGLQLSVKNKIYIMQITVSVCEKTERRKIIIRSFSAYPLVLSGCLQTGCTSGLAAGAGKRVITEFAKGVFTHVSRVAYFALLDVMRNAGGHITTIRLYAGF